jgi:hypothetical protein
MENSLDVMTPQRQRRSISSGISPGVHSIPLMITMLS